MTMKVGLVGLGRMGRAINTRLSENGFEVTGWDRDPAATKVVVGRGMKAAPHPRAVAEAADVVISIITEDNGVKNVFRGKDGFLSGDVRGKLFIDMSTLQPMTGRELAPVVAAAGAKLIDSPVFGTIPHVLQGKLYAMVGGDAADLERAKPVLDKLASKIAHMGPNGAGYAMKLCINLGLAAFIQATSEALALGTREGLKLEQMLDIMSEAPTANGWFNGKKGALKGEPADVTLDLKTMRKDIMSMVATGAVNGMPMPLSSGMLSSFSAAVAQGWGDKDIGDLAKFFRENMGQKF
jgi:3-hydroxyisobutyrate dehydrogenase-like beta-hydroxyacid dehydrogenase